MNHRKRPLASIPNAPNDRSEVFLVRYILTTWGVMDTEHINAARNPIISAMLIDILSCLFLRGVPQPFGEPVKHPFYI